MRIALAQLNPVIGDIARNADQIRLAIDQARRDMADVLVTSELALLGYPPRDLILRGGVVEACEQAVGELAMYAGDLPIIIGHPRRVEQGIRPLRNSASICTGGKVIAIYDKRLLPGYDVFDEDRYFAPGSDPCVVEIAGRKLGILICEDIWRAGDNAAQRMYPDDPLGDTIRAGCDLLVSLHATPFVYGKWLQHLEQVSRIARENKVPVVMVNEVGGFDDLVFDGRSIVVDANGETRAVLPGWEACTQTVDLEASHAGDRLNVAQTLEMDPLSEMYEALVLGVRDYVRKSAHEQVLLGLSGGIDSALTATIATSALGPENVVGVLMPSRYSSAGSLVDARELANNLNLEKCIELPIEDLHQTARSTFRAAQSGALEGVADENIQARLRGMMLMALSNSRGGLVLATGNKSELAVGYSTLYGDMCGALSVIGDVRKMQVYDLTRWINDHPRKLGFSTAPIPESTISKAPSAELRPDQTDQDSLPPYEVLDDIIDRYVDREMEVMQIVEDTGFDESLVSKIARMIDLAEYKRQQAAVILKVSPRTFGRGRPWPIVMKASTSCPQEIGTEKDIESGIRRDT